MENTIGLLLHDWCNHAGNCACTAWGIFLIRPQQWPMAICQCKRPYSDYKGGDNQFGDYRTYNISCNRFSRVSPFSPCYGCDLYYGFNGWRPAWYKGLA